VSGGGDDDFDAVSSGELAVALVEGRRRLDAGEWSSPGSPDTSGVVMRIMPQARSGRLWRS
jgi:hypothetical protein